MDEMGLKWDKDDRWRLRSDGNKLTIVCHFTEVEAPTGGVCELVREYWRTIGIDLILKLVDWGSYVALAEDNRMEMGATFTWSLRASRFLLSDGAPLVMPSWIVQDTWGIEWHKWFVSDGKKGEEPPEYVKRNHELWWEIVQFTLDEEERIRAIEEILRSQTKHLWAIGTVGHGPRPIIVKTNLQNVSETFERGWDHWDGMRFYPSQYFFKTK